MKLLAILTFLSLLVAQTASAGILASADWSFQQLDPSTYRYSINLHDTGTTNIGTFWYAWIPLEDFLPTSPFNIVSPANWSAAITHAGANDGFAIQWVASTPLAAGHSQSGFQFDSHSTPAQIDAFSPFFKSTPVGTSFVYIGFPETDPGFRFVVPEPSGALLAILGAAGLCAIARRRRRRFAGRQIVDRN